MEPASGTLPHATKSERGKRICATNVALVKSLSSLAAKLLEVELLDSLEQRLELFPVDAHHDEHTEELRVDVRVGQQTLCQIEQGCESCATQTLGSVEWLTAREKYSQPSPHRRFQ